MASHINHNLLHYVAKSKITGKSDRLEDYYFKGWSQNINTGDATIGTSTAFANIVLPSANTSLQISSTNILDVMSVRIAGYDEDFELVEETIQTNGQNAVTLANQYFRINFMRVVSEFTNLGTIYLSPDGSLLVAGLPTAANYIYSIKPGDNTGYIMNSCIPPRLNNFVYPKYAVFSVSADVATSAIATFSLKYTDSIAWAHEFLFFIPAAGSGQIYWPLDGVESIPNTDIDTPTGIDFRMQIRRVGNPGLNASGALAITQGL